MTLKTKSLIGIAVVGLSFACGRYSMQVPQTKTTVDTAEQIQVNTNKNTHRETTSVTEKEPSGATKTTTKIVEDTTTKKESTTVVDQHVEQVIVPAKIDTLNVSALYALGLGNTFVPMYGLSVSKKILGPITIGAFGLTNGTLGVSVGLNF